MTDAPVPKLDFRGMGGPSSAEFARQTRQALWKVGAQAGDRFSQTAKTIRFKLSDDCSLQSQTLPLQLSIANHGNETKAPAAHPVAMSEKVRLYIGGQVADHMSDVTVLGNVLDLFKPLDRHMAET